MRVIAGKYRGKKLKEFDLKTTRPTLDRVKEAMFSTIQFDIINAKVLDLFSGTGALGIECISRGAREVAFVDNNVNAIKIIKENLNGIDGNFTVNNMQYDSFLNSNKHKKFDVVLLDPPFASDYGERAINFLIENNMIEDNGVIVLEKSKDKPINNYKHYQTKVKNYGTVELLILRKI